MDEQMKDLLDILESIVDNPEQNSYEKIQDIRELIEYRQEA